MFGRNPRPTPPSQPLPQQPSGPYSRIPPGTSDRYGDPHRRPPASNQGSYYDGAPPEKRDYSRGQSRQAPSDQIKKLKPVALDENEFIFRNLVAVSPLDYHPSQVNSDFYVIIKKFYVCTARTYDRISQGEIGIPGVPRTWAGISLQDPTVEVEKYDPFQEGGPRYLGSVRADVSFTHRTKTTETPYDQDELEHYFIKVRG